MNQQSIVRRAKEILASQPFIPLSPAEVDPNDCLCCCGAAALALAGLEKTFGARAAAEFLGDLRFERNENALDKAFERLGWEQALCNAVRFCNDTALPNERLRALNAEFDRLETSTRPSRGLGA